MCTLPRGSEQEDTKAGSFCGNGKTWRSFCIPQLQYVDADTERAFEGIGVTQVNCFGQISRLVSLGYLQLHFFADEQNY